MARKEYDNEMRGAAFKNKRKKKGDSRPHYTGSIQIDGEEYWVSVWLQEISQGEREGETMLSMAFNEKDEEGGGSRKRKPSRQKEDDPGDDFDDEIPF